MKILLRVAIIEAVRALTLLFAAVSAFFMTTLAINILNVPYTLLYGDNGLSDLQGISICLSLALLPAVFVAYFPSFAASAFDVRSATRRLSQRETELIKKIEEKLSESAAKAKIKLPVIVWRVQDTGEFNAWAYAHNRVCFTKGILHKYGDTPKGIERLAGIAAHEIGHLRHWDTRILMFVHYLGLPVSFGIHLANATVNRIPFIGLISTVVTIIFRIPLDIAHILSGSTSQLQEYQADRFAAKLMNGVGVADELDDMTHREEVKRMTYAEWALRTHPPSELRHDELTRQAR
ncbi:M48 family metalloprotease [Rhodobacterales bacterium]|nr:M48 family metalloprotease [Rhodobacterales bacterium]